MSEFRVSETYCEGGLTVGWIASIKVESEGNPNAFRWVRISNQPIHKDPRTAMRWAKWWENGFGKFE